MADTLPINFPLPAETASANYDYVDVADGTGIITFYPVKTSDSTEDYILTTNVITAPYGTGVARRIRNASYDFDLTAFNSPRTIKGTAYMSANIPEADTPVNLAYSCQLIKWDGSTETNVSALISGSNITTNTTDQVLITIPCTETHFGIGDVLRATITTTGCSSADSGIVVDPSEEESLDTCKLFIPFKLDI